MLVIQLLGKYKYKDHGPGCQGIKTRPYLKNNKAKSESLMAQEAGLLPGKHKTLIQTSILEQKIIIKRDIVAETCNPST
jgi:hypothetical protein